MTPGFESQTIKQLPIVVVFIGMISLLIMVFSFFVDQTEQRTILLFGGSQPEFKRQLQLLKKDSAGMKDRDLIIVTPAPGSAQYKRYTIKDDQFVIILLGKDGGEKFRSLSVTEPKTLFALIDTMPMRQSEMRRKKNQ